MILTVTSCSFQPTLFSRKVQNNKDVKLANRYFWFDTTWIKVNLNIIWNWRKNERYKRIFLPVENPSCCLWTFQASDVEKCAPMGAAPYNPHHQSLTRHIEITNNLILVSYCYCDIRPHSLVSLYRFYLNIKGVIYVISVHPGVLKHFICLSD